MNKLTERTEKYNTASSILACMSNKQLEQSLVKIKQLIDLGKNDKSIDLDDLHREKKYCEIAIKKLKSND